MILRRLVLVDKLQRAGAEKDCTKPLSQLDDTELNRLAIKYGLENDIVRKVRT